jgi:hypothetical protein
MMEVPIQVGKELVTFKMSPELYRSMYDTGLSGIKSIAQTAIALPVKLQKAGLTGINPGFAMLVNSIRDPLYMMMFGARAGLHRTIPSYLWTVARAIAHFGTKGKIRQDPFIKLGNKSGVFLSGFVSSGREMSRSTRNKLAGRISVLRNPLDALQSFLNEFEKIPRAAAARARAWQKGIKWDGKRALSVDEWLDLSKQYREGAVDFKDVGRWTAFAEMLNPYFNASVQSTRGAARAFRDRPFQTLARLSTLSGLTIAYWMQRRDDEDYKTLDADERNYGFYFQTPGGNSVVIPIDPSLSLFKSAVEETLNVIYKNDDDPELWKKFEKVFVDSFSPIDFLRTESTEWIPFARGVPIPKHPYFTWLAETFSNRTTYYGTPLEPRRFEDYKPEDRFGPHTSRAAVFLGRTMGWSPMKIDHAVRTYFGTLGRDIMKALDAPSLALMKELKGEKWVEALPKPPENLEEMGRLPVLGRLFRRGGALGEEPEVNVVYDRWKESLKEKNSLTKFETPEQEWHRAMLTDAVAALTVLKRIRDATATTIKDREKYTRQINDIARSVIHEKKRNWDDETINAMRRWWTARQQQQKLQLRRAAEER